MAEEIVSTAAQPPAARFTALAGLPLQHKLGFMIVAAAAVALAAGAWLWSQAPDYRVLYANVSDRDGGAIVAAIQQMNVPYKLTEGAIQVPADKVYEVRLRLAGEGLPKGGPLGFELMENAKLGTSQFLEQVNYQRALEGELARSIQSLSAVQAARVHLALARQSAFVRDRQSPRASVLLNLYPGRALEPTQVSAIAHLVASSVPDLPLANVTVVDQGGHLLSSPGASASGLDESQLRYVHDLEQSYAKRIEAILTPLVGNGNVRAEVTADVDFSQVERAEELYKPNNHGSESAVRSEQVSETKTQEQAAAAAGTASGVPGALSNRPPATASAPLEAPPKTAVAAPDAKGNPPAAAAANAANATNATNGNGNAAALNSRKDATINYEVDKTVRHVRQPIGGVRRLSIAVVVNHRRVADAAGKASWQPLSAKEIEQLTTLAKEAAGYNEQRGDTLNVVNSLFTTPESAPLKETPFWKKPETWLYAKDVAKQLLIAAAALYIVLGVLRPMIASILAARPPLPVPELDTTSASMHVARLNHEQRLHAAQQIAQQEPKLVANVVKEWISQE
jgi:flagellar M-ring protein FliF